MVEDILADTVEDDVVRAAGHPAVRASVVWRWVPCCELHNDQSYEGVMW
jgi:hypothetical protein